MSTTGFNEAHGRAYKDRDFCRQRNIIKVHLVDVSRLRTESDNTYE
jgi:hypothetical protein